MSATSKSFDDLNPSVVSDDTGVRGRRRVRRPEPPIVFSQTPDGRTRILHHGNDAYPISNTSTSNDIGINVHVYSISMRDHRPH